MTHRSGVSARSHRRVTGFGIGMGVGIGIGIPVADAAPAAPTVAAPAGALPGER